LSIRFPSDSQNEPHEQVVDLVTDQLKLVNKEKVLIINYAALEASTILEDASTRFHVRHFDLHELLSEMQGLRMIEHGYNHYFFEVYPLVLVFFRTWQEKSLLYSQWVLD
jgi:hypothetical protein